MRVPHTSPDRTHEGHMPPLCRALPFRSPVRSRGAPRSAAPSVSPPACVCAAPGSRSPARFKATQLWPRVPPRVLQPRVLRCGVQSGPSPLARPRCPHSPPPAPAASDPPAPPVPVPPQPHAPAWSQQPSLVRVAERRNNACHIAPFFLPGQMSKRKTIAPRKLVEGLVEVADGLRPPPRGAAPAAHGWAPRRSPLGVSRVLSACREQASRDLELFTGDGDTAYVSPAGVLCVKCPQTALSKPHVWGAGADFSLKK